MKVKKESYIMIRVTEQFKVAAKKASGKGKLSKYIIALIENNDKFKEANRK